MNSRLLDWFVEADVESTRRAYEAMQSGDASRCGCPGCKNFLAVRESVFPPEFVEFCANTGIDLSRELVIAYVGKSGPGKGATYWGTFQFVGRMMKGPRGRKLSVTTRTSHEDRTDINIGFSAIQYPLAPTFSVSVFETQLSPAAPFRNRPLVGVDFFVTTDWVISETYRVIKTGGPS